MINSKSTPSAPANICLFDTPPSQVAFNKGKWMTYGPTNAVDSKGPYTFNIFDSAHFFQLNRSYVSFKLRLRKVDTDSSLEKTPVKISHANLIGATFFKQIKLFFNNVQIYDSDDYHYKSYIQTLLGDNDETKNGYLQASGWKSSKTDEHLLSSTTDLDLCAPLMLEPFQTERLLLPHINIQLIFYRNDDTFCLESATDTDAFLEVSDLKLHMRAIDVVASATIALENRLKFTPAQYPFTVTKVKSIAVPEGRFELPFYTLYHDVIPRRIIIAITSPEIVTTKNSLYFDHYDVSEVQLDAGGTMYPPQPIQCNFENNTYAQAFVRLYEEIGSIANKSSPRITYKMFKNGYTLFAFNISPLESSNSWELLKTGSTQLFMKFSKKTPAGGVNILVLSQFDGVYEIDSFRNVTVNAHH